MAAVLTSRLKARLLFVLAAMVVAIMAASVMSNASGSLGSSLLGTKEADAAVSYRQIKGTVFRSDSGQAVPYATVKLYWWKSGCSCWSYWKNVQANSYGRYSFSNNNTGLYYIVQAQKNIGGNTYTGNGKSFLLSSGSSRAFTSNVTIPIQSPF